MAQETDPSSLTLDSAALKTRTNLADDAADLVRRMILLESLPPGMALPEREISNALGISRTPLRIAMRLLVHEGLVEYSASRRPRVADPSLDEISDYLRVQGVLEALGGELACVNATDKELQQIARMNEEMVEMSGKEEPLESFERDMAIHSKIVAAGKNQPLIETHASYSARLWRARFMSSQREQSRESTFNEHQLIVDALVARDAKKTAKALTRHLTTAVSNISLATKEREKKRASV